jgi:hypothetical protein
MLRVVVCLHNDSQAGETTMRRLIWVAAFSVLATTMPSRAQNPGLPVCDGEIVIPSERSLERDAVTQQQNDFSTNDATAQEMNRQNRRFDREVEKGICTDC